MVSLYGLFEIQDSDRDMDKIKKQKYIIVSAAVSIVLAVVTAVSYYIAMKNDFDSSIEHFASGSAAFVAFAVSAAVSAVFSLALSVILTKNQEIASEPKTSILSAFGAVLSAVMCISIVFSETGAFAKSSSAETSAPVIIAAVLTVFIGVSAILNMLKIKIPQSVRIVVATLAVAAVIVRLFASYFDFSHPINGPVRNINTIIEASALIFLISEARLTFGTAKSPLNKTTAFFYLFSCMVMVSVGFGFSLGALIYGIVNGYSGNPNLSLMRLALYISLAFIALDRILAYASISESVPENEKAKKHSN